MGTWRGATQRLPTPSSTCTRGEGGLWGPPAPHGSLGWQEGRAPGQGGIQPPAAQPCPAYPADAPAGSRAEPCLWMPWTAGGAQHGLAPTSFPQMPPCPGVWPAAPTDPPVHPWGARRAGFAAKGGGGPAGAMAEPLNQPGLGGVLEILSASEQGRSRPRSPRISPRLPSRRVRPALISAAPGSWEK